MDSLPMGSGKVKVTLIIYSLYSGGAERVMSIMANYWAAQGWSVTLLTFTDGQEPPFYSLDDRVKYRPLGIAKDSTQFITAMVNNLNRIRLLRSAIVDSHPDAVISFMVSTNVVTLLASWGLKVPVLVSERINAIRVSKGVWGKLRRWIYPTASRIVVQTQRAWDDLPPKLKSLACVIPNPVLVPPANVASQDYADSSQPDCQHHIISVGRLEHQKGFDLLLQAFANLQAEYPTWNLIILGDGSLQAELMALAQDLGIADRVFLLGRVKNVYERLKRADLFVMSSRIEGFPNALCEAMACGLPVISTDCPQGPREIIRDGVDGLLVPTEDVAALTTAMAGLMADETKRARLAHFAPEVTQRFSVDTILQQWEVHLQDVIRQSTGKK